MGDMSLLFLGRLTNRLAISMIQNAVTIIATDNQFPEWDLQKIRIDQEGVHDFFWPLAYGDIMEFNNRSIDAYADILQKAEETLTPAEIIPYQVFGKYYLSEIAGIYRALLLQKRCLEAGKTPKLPDNWLFCCHIWQGKASSEIAYLKFFQNGSAQQKRKKITQFSLGKIFNILKKFKPNKNGLMLDGLRILPVTGRRLQNSIIVTQRTALISKHANNVDKEKIFCRSDRWFSSVSDEEIKDSSQSKNVEIEKEIFNIFKNLCADKQLAISDDISAYLKEFIEKGASCLRVHSHRLQNASVILPQHIWTGTAGNAWDLLLRLAVMERGGVVEAHDHGMASGLTKTYIVPFLELWGCSKFHTYTEAHADLLRKLAKNIPTLSQKIPKIMGLDEKQKTKITSKYSKAKEVKTIMIVSTLYDRDRGRMAEVAAEISKVDFQARLIAYLISQGYNVIFKAHPESPSQPPPAFITLGAKIENGRFNKVYHKADLFLFDYAYTSTFQEALETDLPFVMVDVENVEWEETMLPLFEKRASLVRGRQDQDNRFVVEWIELDQAIKEAPSKAGDRIFYETYFNMIPIPAVER